MAFRGEKSFSQVAIDKGTGGSGKQIIPIVSQGQGIKRYLETKTNPQGCQPIVCPAWKEEFEEPFT
jgi:hypothetical protein